MHTTATKDVHAGSMAANTFDEAEGAGKAAAQRKPKRKYVAQENIVLVKIVFVT